MKRLIISIILFIMGVAGCAYFTENIALQILCILWTGACGFVTLVYLDYIRD